MERWLEICIYDRWKFASGKKDFSIEDASSLSRHFYAIGVDNLEFLFFYFGSL